MSNQGGNVILGTLLGAAIGVAAGLLLAPAKGSETREKLKEKANEAKDSIDELAASALESINKIKASAEESWRGTSRVAKKEAGKMKGEVERELNNV